MARMNRTLAKMISDSRDNSYKNRVLRAENKLGNSHNIEKRDKGNIFKRIGMFIFTNWIYVIMMAVIISFIGYIIFFI